MIILLLNLLFMSYFSDLDLCLKSQDPNEQIDEQYYRNKELVPFNFGKKVYIEFGSVDQIFDLMVPNTDKDFEKKINDRLINLCQKGVVYEDASGLTPIITWKPVQVKA